jgi:hypothetical protein
MKWETENWNLVIITTCGLGKIYINFHLQQHKRHIHTFGKINAGFMMPSIIEYLSERKNQLRLKYQPLILQALISLALINSRW